MKHLKTEFLIIIFLWLNIIYSMINLPRAEIFLIAGIIGLTIVTIFYFLKKNVNIIILALLLGLGSINLISFNDSFQINFMGFFNIINFILFVILIYKKWNVISELNEKWFGTPKKEYIERSKKQVDFFKKKFENLSTDELKSKMNDNLVDEAKKAINELIKKRNE